MKEKELRPKSPSYLIVISEILLLLFLFQFVLMFFTVLPPIHVGKKVTVEELTFSEYTFETNLRCAGFTTIYDKDGNRSYDIVFRLNELDNILHAYVNADIVDKDGGISKENRYNATITLVYNPQGVDYFYPGEKLNENILEYLNSDYGTYFYDVLDIDFMYENGVELETREDIEIKLIGNYKEYVLGEY